MVLQHSGGSLLGDVVPVGVLGGLLERFDHFVVRQLGQALVEQRLSLRAFHDDSGGDLLVPGVVDGGLVQDLAGQRHVGFRGIRVGIPATADQRPEQGSPPLAQVGQEELPVVLVHPWDLALVGEDVGPDHPEGLEVLHLETVGGTEPAVDRGEPSSPALDERAVEGEPLGGQIRGLAELPVPGQRQKGVLAVDLGSGGPNAPVYRHGAATAYTGGQDVKAVDSQRQVGRGQGRCRQTQDAIWDGVLGRQDGEPQAVHRERVLERDLDSSRPRPKDLCGGYRLIELDHALSGLQVDQPSVKPIGDLR